MKKFSVITLLFFFSTLVSISQPKLEFIGGDTYNWGDVRGRDSVIRGNVLIKNSGNNNLIFKGVHAGCGCTKLNEIKDTLPPGETTRLEFELNLLGYQSELKKSITIITNDPSKKTTRYNLVANVIRDLTVLPYTSLQFTKMPWNRESKRSVTLKNFSKKKIKCTNLRAEPNLFRFNLTKDFYIDPGQELTLEATITPTDPELSSGKICFETDSDEVPKIEIFLWISIEPETLPQNLRK